MGILFEYISKSITGDGFLPDGFKLPKPEDEKKAIFANVTELKRRFDSAG